jgi:hypothetical protein
MSEFVQTLESRTFFSSSLSAALTGGGQLAKDVQAASADLTHYGSTLATEVKTLASDFRALPASASNRKLILQLQRDERASLAVLRRDVVNVIHAATGHGHKIVFDAIRVYFQPTNVVYLSRLAADFSAVSGAVAGPLAKLESDVQSGRSILLGDLNNLVSANPSASQLQADTQQIQTDSQSAITQITADGQALQNDLTSLVQNLGGA